MTHSYACKLVLALCLLYPSVLRPQSSTWIRTCGYYVGQNPRIKLEGIFGPITVKGIDGDTAKIRIIRHATVKNKKDLESLLRSVTVNINHKKGWLKVATRGPNNTRRFGEYGYEVSIEVSVPHTSSLYAATSFGQITVSNIERNVVIEGKHGSVSVRNTGDVTVRNTFGPVTVTNVNGKVDIDNKHGDIQCHTFLGGNISNLFGSVIVSNAQDYLKVRIENGSFEARDIMSGDIKVMQGECNIRLAKAFQGKVDAVTSFAHLSTNLRIKPYKRGPSEQLIGWVGKGTNHLRAMIQDGDLSINK